MQDMMLQLNLPGKTIQQGQASQAYGKSNKTSGEDRFRNLLEHSSKSSEEAPKKNDAVGKTDTQKPEKPETNEANAQQPGKPEEKPKVPDGNDEAVDNESLWKAQAQAVQFLLMGNSQPQTQEAVSKEEVFLEVQPEAIAPIQMDTRALTEEILPEMTETLLTNDGVSGNAEEGISISQTWADQLQGKETNAAETLTQTAAEAPVKVQTSQKEPVQTETKVAAADKGETISQTAIPRTDRQQAGENTQKELGTEQSEPSDSIQPYLSETIQQPGTFQNQMQETAGVEQPVFIQANSPQELMENLVDQLQAKVSLGNQEFEIHLQPENLGKLAIKVAYTAEKVSISIICTNERTMELLSSGAKNIAQIMEESLGSPTTVLVDHEESNYLEQYNNQENSKQQQQEPEQKKKQEEPDNHEDFLQQLRLGLI